MAGTGDQGTGSVKTSGNDREELNVVYNLYETQGGEGLVMQEGKLLFAQIIASRITGYPLEAIYKIKAKDSVTLKNRVYRFFFLAA